MDSFDGKGNKKNGKSTMVGIVWIGMAEAFGLQVIFLCLLICKGLVISMKMLCGIYILRTFIFTNWNIIVLIVLKMPDCTDAVFFLFRITSHSIA